MTTDDFIKIGCSNCEELFNEDEMKWVDGAYICKSCLVNFNCYQFLK